ncbi:DNA-directed RNA polymerase subunit alpha [Mycoplasmopsis opalescens]|uniref:DNA-directed RNA polymerase subunit alpha n=1 Tax=Mycoplasmopsis opalescens TaxID=114886 RepID=UPI0004A77661|nr:DNA-directed RNA polymerase subunit alpha [Mycoplasmopsis opalescens]
MEQMAKLEYTEIKSNSRHADDEATFVLQPLERGHGQTIAVALRRELLSNISSLALFAIKIEGVDHEFQTIPGVVEDVTTLIMNLRKVKFQYDPELVSDDEIVKATIKVDEAGLVTSRSIEINNSSVEIINKTLEIANVSSKGSLNVELYLRSGRGFISNEENKKLIANPALFTSKITTKIKKGLFIATDSNFSPVENVNYQVTELNTGSAKVEEKLIFNVRTNGSITAKAAIKQACEILVAHFSLVGNVDELKVADVFKKEEIITTTEEDNDLDLAQLNLSVRSSNALKKIGKLKLSEIASMTFEELEQTKNLGRKSLDEIVDKLREHGLELSKGDEL